MAAWPVPEMVVRYCTRVISSPCSISPSMRNEAGTPCRRSDEADARLEQPGSYFSISF